jgi:serine acetyltransferase
VTVGRKTNRPYWDALLVDRRSKQPRFFAAVVADAKITAAAHGERSEFRGRADAVLQALRLAWTSDAFLAQVLYRAQSRLDALGIPVLPRLAHRLAMMTAQVCIGRTVVMHPGVYLGHGQVVVDGFVEIHSGVVIMSWVTIGLRSGE